MKRLTQSLFLVFALALLTACASLGVPSAETVNQKAVAAYTTVEGVANAITSLRAAGKLSETDRDNMVASLRSAITGIDIAKQLGSTNPGAGMSKLDAQIAILTALNGYLATKGKP